ncbi:D-alanyl-D-alanine carboxypeptidase/D-alanyl-D-alanine-endopeptidase (penicillin-binding protein 4) [Prauserella sediminis]|uniref:D-alanyl-D-alanine carboxypeptidase/D-alanyl-D-alanine-endopeptidase (Penicillin-binding protein 4) n=1 Tax=Prauserella sediminis TaxID=577680 RepID=A0A839XTY9_9PSEU|nr:D-alanyl-D-alanine carboxypeptidase/D-alanyl-D-alanine-endopeptidase [Prauserella sediminis]MBB3663305.1 D-alanyl-D-alanine carboxypeptidase/D-alanyl-D-alanine-endopeptidase (penicillin-binding protein 4) [Prauserella sediminis]
MRIEPARPAQPDGTARTGSGDPDATAPNPTGPNSAAPNPAGHSSAGHSSATRRTAAPGTAAHHGRGSHGTDPHGTDPRGTAADAGDRGGAVHHGFPHSNATGGDYRGSADGSTHSDGGTDGDGGADRDGTDSDATVSDAVAAAGTGAAENASAANHGSDGPPTGPEGPAAADSDPEPEPKRRRGRALLFSGLALVLVVALGITLALPAVSNRLGLPWAPNLPKGDEPEPVAVTRQLQSIGGQGDGPTANGLRQALEGPASSGALGTLSGTVVDATTGDTLWSQGENRAVTPASATKILTAAAALLELGPDMRLSTKAYEAVPGRGGIIVRAGGDVTLSSLPEGEESLYHGAAHLDELAKQIDEATNGNVRAVALEQSVFTTDKTGQGWADEDAPSTYAAPLAPIMLDGGRQDPLDDTSERFGDPAQRMVDQLAGKFAAAEVDPELTKGSRAAQLEESEPIAEVQSAPMERLVQQMLQLSDNTLAEAIQHHIAISKEREPSFEGGAKATLDVLREHGFDVGGATLHDGSGLSVDNRVTAKLLSEVMAVAAAPGGSAHADERTSKLRPLLAGLPVAGGTGTLAERYTEGTPAQGRGWVRAKTGTIPSTGTNALTGQVVTVDGRTLAFSLVTSKAGNTDAARDALDTVTATLRECGCR